MKLPLILALLALPLQAVCAQAQVRRDVIDDLSPARKASAETRQAPPRSPATKPDDSAAAGNNPDDQTDGDHPGESVVGEMPKDLSAAVSRALQRNPLVLIAEAKVHQAQAESNEVKFKVVGDVTRAFRLYAHYKQALAEIKNSNGPNDDSHRQIRDHLETSELDLIYLLGIGAGSSPPSPEQGGISVDKNNFEWNFIGMRGAPPSKAPASRKASEWFASQKKQRESHALAIPKALRTALAAKTELEFKDSPLEDAVDYLAERHQVQFVKLEKSIKVSVTCHISGVSLAAALQAIADLTNYCFVFRDYGILVVERGHALDYMRNQVPMIAPGEPSPPAEDSDGEFQSPYGARY